MPAPRAQFIERIAVDDVSFTVAPIMRSVGHAFPHAWAVDAWTILMSRGGGVVDISRQLLVLGAFAAGLLVVATVRLGRRIA